MATSKSGLIACANSECNQQFASHHGNMKYCDTCSGRRCALCNAEMQTVWDYSVARICTDCKKVSRYCATPSCRRTFCSISKNRKFCDVCRGVACVKCGQPTGRVSKVTQCCADCRSHQLLCAVDGCENLFKPSDYRQRYCNLCRGRECSRCGTTLDIKSWRNPPLCERCTMKPRECPKCGSEFMPSAQRQRVCAECKGREYVYVNVNGRSVKRASSCYGATSRTQVV